MDVDNGNPLLSDTTLQPPSQDLDIWSQFSRELRGTASSSKAVNNNTSALTSSAVLQELSQDHASQQNLRILSLDGGGVKGYTALLILQRIINTYKELSGLDDDTVLKPCQIFDLIIGTSTGGLIATMLGRLEMSVEEALQQYEAVGKKVFRKPAMLGSMGKAARALASRPFFDIESLQKAVKALLREKNINEDEQFCVAPDPICKVMLCVTNKQTSKSDVFRNYKISHPTQNNHKCTIWEASSATAAAPAYFKRVKLQHDDSIWVDGGFTQNRNNPIHEVVAEIEREKAFKSKKIGCLLSIGTGAPSVKDISNHVIPMMKHAIDMLTDSEEIANEFAKTKTCVALETSNRYFRFNVPHGMDSINLDDYKETSKMRALTDNYLRVVGTGNAVLKCAETLYKPDENIHYEDASQNSILPDRNVLHFVERLAYIERLKAFFQDNANPTKRFVLHGMGGIGKTQLALHFAHEMKRHYKVFWVGADSFSSFVKDYILIYSKLVPKASGAANVLQQADLLKRTTEALEHDSESWILVLDNADDLDTFVGNSDNVHSIDKHLPKIGKILLTTRDPRFVGMFSPISDNLPVEVMGIDDAQSLLLKSLPSNIVQEAKDEHIKKLLLQLGHLPLGIAQAAVNIRDLAISLEEYLRLFLEKSHQMELLGEPFMDTQTTSDRNRKQSCLITWEFSFLFLEEHYPQAMIILEFRSLLHWQAIPSFIVKLLPEFKDVDGLTFTKLLARLAQSSLMTRTATGPSQLEIHPMVHARIFARLTEAKALERLSSMLRLMSFIFPEEDLWTSSSFSKTSRHLTARLLLPHAIQLIQRLEEKRIVSLPAAALYKRVASYLLYVGRTAYSVELSLKAYTQAQEASPPEDESAFIMRIILINTLIVAERYDEALAHVLQMMAILSKPQSVSQFSGEAWKNAKERTQSQNLFLLFQTHDHPGFKSAVQQIINEALQSGNLSILKVLYKVALLLVEKQHSAMALILSELLCKIYEDFGLKFMKKADRLSCAFSLSLAASMLMKCLPLSCDTITLKETSRQALDLATRSLHELWSLRDATSRKIWNTCWQVASLARMEVPEVGLDALEKVVHRAQRLPKLDFETEIIVPEIGSVIQSLLSYSVELKIFRKTMLRKRIERIMASIEQLLEHLDAVFMDTLLDPMIASNVATDWLRTGSPAKALSLCDLTLAIHSEVLSLRARKEWLNLHITTIACLLRLPGRASEVEKHLRKHPGLLLDIEAEAGPLEMLRARFEKGDKLYEAAKQLRDTGKLKYKDEWWEEHASDLEEAELFHGLLFEED